MKPTKLRIDSIDLLRGIVMVIMMLDHTRDFIHRDALVYDPLDLSQTNTILFFTRWITHYCAPVFVFLAGTSIYLQFARGKSKSELSRFLITRGFWLIILEFTIVRFGYSFNFDYRFLGLMQVIWAIGVSMIILAGLIHLPLRVIAGFGIGMITLHNLLDRFPVQPWQGPNSLVPGFGAKIWMILHQPGVFPIVGFPSPVIFVLYPLIPWIGVMAAGYALAAVYGIEALRRRRLLLIIGGGVTTLFIALRALNQYGDPQRWSEQKTAVFTFLSFLNTTKYPASLLFLLMTLGPAIAALAWFEVKKQGPISGALITFGRVPLFFYLLQWCTAHLIAIILGYLAGQPVAWQFKNLPERFPPPPGVGFNLFVTYLSWIGGVLLLYPLCRWFAGVKQRRRDWWLSYL